MKSLILLGSICCVAAATEIKGYGILEIMVKIIVLGFVYFALRVYEKW